MNRVKTCLQNKYMGLTEILRKLEPLPPPLLTKHEGISTLHASKSLYSIKLTLLLYNIKRSVYRVVKFKLFFRRNRP